jgi:hypothetical protein
VKESYEQLWGQKILEARLLVIGDVAVDVSFLVCVDDNEWQLYSRAGGWNDTAFFEIFVALNETFE